MLSCFVESCNIKHHAKYLCKKHYSVSYNKNNPEMSLKISRKQLEKYGKIFDMTSMKYNYANQSWSKSVRNRDNYECQYCNSTENLHAHHIFYKTKYSQLSLNLNNGISLCKDCHYEVHDLNGWR